MAEMKLLLAELENQKKGVNPRRDAWIASVKGLVQDIRNWLSVPKKRGLLDIKKESLQYSERGIGSYEVDGLEISTPTTRIWFRAVELNSDVGDGRAELWTADKAFTLIRRTGSVPEWYVFDEDIDPDKWKPLTEQVFESMTLELIKS